MLLLLGGFLLLMLVGLPVALAMAVSSLVYILVSGITPDVTLAQRMIAGVESFPLLAVPFFILAGNLMNIAGVTGRIYKFAVALVGWMRGGLGHVNIIGSVIFSGMSGTAIADAAGLGTIEIKAMKDHGYSTEFAVGVTAASATLGPIIPPSLPFVIYGMMANVSIGALFLGGVIPGVVMTLFMMATVAYFAHRNGWGSDAPFSWPQIGSAALEIFIVLAFPMVVWLLVVAGLSVNMAVGLGLVVLLALDWYFDFSAVMALMAPVILIGGMTLGWFTPTEAAVAAVIWSLFLGLVRYRSMTLQTVAKATFDTIETTASVLFIVTAASIFAWLLTVSQAAQILTDAILGITQNKWVFLLLANILILFVGCFIDTIAAITILVPILLPIVLKLGIDPIHFGLIMTLNLMIGLLHPPLGMVLFVLARVAKLSVERTTMAILPWLVPLLLALVAITYIPELTLWLPKYMGLLKMTSMALAATLFGPEDLRMVERPLDPLASGMVRIRFGAGGICGSDMHYYRHARTGDFVVTSPLVLGHEIAGEVVEIAGSAAGVKVGDRVALNPSRWCGHCKPCRENRPNLCENIFFMGSASKTPHMQGGFASYFDAIPAQCVKIPDHVTYQAAALAEPLAVCLHAVARAGDVTGKRAVLFGAGPIGLLTMLAAQRAGIAETTVVDIAAAPLAFATKLGASHVVDISGGEEALKAQAAASPFDLAFEVSGTAAGLASAIGVVRRGGVVVQVGNLPGGQIPVPANAVMAKEIDLRGSFRFGTEFFTAVELIADGSVDVLSLVTAQRPLSVAPDAVRLALDRSQSVKVVLTA